MKIRSHEMNNSGTINDALNRIQAYYDSLSMAEKKIADFIQENYYSVIRMSLADVADEAGVSDATVVRFFRLLGYKRWVEFIVSLSRSIPMTSDLIYEAINTSDTPGVIAEKVMGGAIQAIQATMEVLDHNAMEKCINYIDNARHTFIVAVGNSGPMAEELFRMETSDLEGIVAESSGISTEDGFPPSMNAVLAMLE
ncbi:MAG: hypothetical protein LC101_03245, partial [Flavobacteriales bacterium]|nr:hypothetical protein [Flavobacteriales bacterium]